MFALIVPIVPVVQVLPVLPVIPFVKPYVLSLSIVPIFPWIPLVSLPLQGLPSQLSGLAQPFQPQLHRSFTHHQCPCPMQDLEISKPHPLAALIQQLSQQWLQTIEAPPAPPPTAQPISTTNADQAQNLYETPDLAIGNESVVQDRLLNTLIPQTTLPPNTDAIDTAEPLDFLEPELDNFTQEESVEDSLASAVQPDQAFMLSDIPASVWTDEIDSYNPERVYRHRENLVVQQGSTDEGLSSGVYIYELGSSFRPQQGEGPDGFLFEDGGSALGGGRVRYKYRHRF